MLEIEGILQLLHRTLSQSTHLQYVPLVTYSPQPLYSTWSWEMEYDCNSSVQSQRVYRVEEHNTSNTFLFHLLDLTPVTW